ncbi:glycine zipper domain-containing protein [Paenibacillus sp. GCM10028914]|uniref:glycine zipper domain-containing protein n=1 Tax=Paenibacillus sp. GCM10028914 TaxID=3273416 RepID=UPI00361721C2
MTKNKSNNRNGASERNNTDDFNAGETVGTVGGGAVGAVVGSALGPIGTVVGGAVGAALGNKAGDVTGDTDEKQQDE